MIIVKEIVNKPKIIYIFKRKNYQKNVRLKDSRSCRKKKLTDSYANNCLKEV